MRLLNFTLKYLAVILPVIIGLWAALFYFNMVDEIEDSIDDGLNNYKMLIIQHAVEDPSILERRSFGERNYVVQEIPSHRALSVIDTYTDTMMFMLNEGDYEPFRKLSTAFKQGEKYYELQVVSSTLEQDDLIEDLLWSIVLLYIVLLVSALVVNNWILRKLWRPFYVLLEKIGEFSLESGKGISRTSSRVKEFQELDERIVNLTAQVVSAYNQQKQFVENASHELQTPLAISMNKLELLSEQPDLSEESLLSVVDIMKVLKRMGRLNKSLLLLTKIEHLQYVGLAHVSVNQVIKDLLIELEDFAEARGIKMPLEEIDELSFYVNPDLAAILFGNILRNALIHQNTAADVQIIITSESLIIKNQGERALDPAVFERFHKMNESKQGIGLGLSIVRAIADVSGLAVNYSFSDGYHQFSVSKNKF